jgi:SAM-dependent methyltransferase
MTGGYRDYGYASDQPGSGEAGRALAARFARIVRANAPAASRICDLGCGNGYLAAILGRMGHRVTGVDASPSGIEIARKHHAAPNVDFTCAQLDAPAVEGLPAGAFDIVVSSDVIEHLYRPDMLVSVAHRLLKPRGVLLVGTPYHGWLKNGAISVLGRWDSHHAPNWIGGHIKFFSRVTLSKLARAHGFSVLGFEYHGRAPGLWKNMICIARKDGD